MPNICSSCSSQRPLNARSPLSARIAFITLISLWGVEQTLENMVYAQPLSNVLLESAQPSPQSSTEPALNPKLVSKSTPALESELNPELNPTADPNPTLELDAARVVFELNQVSVNETKPDGKSWDFGLGMISRPDLVVRVKLGERLILKSKKCKNTFSCALTRRSSPVQLTPGETLTITVTDRDLKRDDIVDQLTITLSPERLKRSRVFKIAGKSVSLFVMTLHSIE